jgi:hypothetical protein
LIALALALVLLELGLPSLGSAQSMQVPAAVQAGLIAKVAGFDRNFTARAGGKVLILLAAMPGDAESMHTALEMKGALSRLPKVGDLPHEEQIVVLSSATALAENVRARKAAIVYFGSGFGKQVPAIREAFSGLNVLTIGAIPDYVPSGIVLGFDLVSGRPKLLVHIAQARKQQVSFPGSVLNLMKVYP